MSKDLRLPPQSIEVEENLLGAILQNQDNIIQIADTVVASDFYSQKHQIIYEAMIAIFEKREPIDVLTVSEKLTNEDNLQKIGGISYLNELSNLLPTAANAPHYAEIISAKATLRSLINAGNDIAMLGHNEEKEIRDILDEAEQKLFAVSQAQLKNEYVPIREILGESFERLDSLHKDKETIRGVSTGFIDLDAKLNGMGRSDLIILAARPAMGKTSFALNIAANVAIGSNLPVLIFSLEMGNEQLTDRLIAAVGNIELGKMRSGNLDDMDFENITNAMGLLADSPLFLDDAPGVNILEMRAKARRLQMEQKQLGLIVVDYLQLINSRTRGDRNQEISEISRGLKILAKELNVPVLALSQLSRSVESRSPQIPMLSDLRDSGSIEQDADVVAFIYRDEYYNEDTTEKPNVADILIKKHRNGPTADVELYWDGRLTKFSNLSK